MPHGHHGWIRRDLRFAIYIRDGFDCVYCRGVFPIDPLGFGLTLDHIEDTPTDCSFNDRKNLITACASCNSSRQALPLAVWARKQGFDVKKLLRRVERHRQRPINREAGAWIIQLRRASYVQTPATPEQTEDQTTASVAMVYPRLPDRRYVATSPSAQAEDVT